MAWIGLYASLETLPSIARDGAHQRLVLETLHVDEHDVWHAVLAQKIVDRHASMWGTVPMVRQGQGGCVPGVLRLRAVDRERSNHRAYVVGDACHGHFELAGLFKRFAPGGVERDGQGDGLAGLDRVFAVDHAGGGFEVERAGAPAA